MNQDNNITASDLVVLRLQQHGIRQAFGVTGGAIMYITDALRRCDGISSTFTHHEQSAAIAAEAYAKITNQPALVFATAGPGVTNLVTGVADAFMDSIPMVVLIGDVRSTIAADFSRQRYNAPQEVNQAALLKPIVKHYLPLTPQMESFELIESVDKAVQVAVSGRKGPVCISMPLDVQGIGYNSSSLNAPIQNNIPVSSYDQNKMLLATEALTNSSRPLILLGAGVRGSGMVDSVTKIINKYSIPYCVTIGGLDIQDKDNPLSCGCVGPTSQRAANLIFYEADCVLALGTSFDQSVTGFNIEDLVANKSIYLINVDPGEYLRFQNLNIHPIEADLSSFMKIINKDTFRTNKCTNWLKRIAKIKSILTVEAESKMRTTARGAYLSAYDITAEISRNLSNQATIILGISLDAVSVFNSFQITKGQRVLFSRNLGPMGWDVPALLGAAFSSTRLDSLILITGDGSLMLNIQELSIIAGMNIPVCIFVFNNDGYVSMRTTQSNFFGQEFFGCNSSSGLNIPKLEPLARGFGFEYSIIKDLSDIGLVISEHKNIGKPRIVECLIDPAQLREPRLVSTVVDGKFKTPVLHEMTPNLSLDLKEILH
jgi:acetolactate synthase-1/2/3 large subunit